MITTTRILDWLGIIFLGVRMIYRVGGWRKWWARAPLSARAEIDPRAIWSMRAYNS
jgi:hypothetical protein